MEAELNEQTPLLGDGARPKQQLIEANFPEEPTMPHRNQSFDKQEPLDGNLDISKKLTPLDESNSSFNEPEQLDENITAVKKPAPLDENDAISRKQTPPVGEGTSNLDTNPPIICSPRTFERKRNVFTLEEAVQALYSAWLRNRQPNREVTSDDYFTVKEVCALHIAWKNVTSGRRYCSSAPHLIAEALATAMARELLSVPECIEEEISIDFHMRFVTTKNLLKASLLQEWSNIEEGEWFPVRYTETIFEDSDEQPPSVSEFWLRQVELYDKAQDFFRNPKLQTVLPTLLFFWPLSILAIGSKYMECPIGHHLSYLLMILGCIGCVATVYRLALLYIANVELKTYRMFWKWKMLRLIEFTFFIVFLVQAFHFFDIDPIAELDSNQCIKDFYKETLVLNYVSIPLVSAYVLVYSVLACVNQFDIWRWVFRHL